MTPTLEGGLSGQSGQMPSRSQDRLYPPYNGYPTSQTQTAWAKELVITFLLNYYWNLQIKIRAQV